MIGFVLHNQIVITPRVMDPDTIRYAQSIGAEPMEYQPSIQPDISKFAFLKGRSYKIHGNCIVDDYVIEPWTLEHFMVYASQVRYQKETAPIEIKGHKVDCSRESRLQLLALSGAQPIKCLDYQFIFLSEEELKQLQAQMQEQVKNAFCWEYEAQQRIRNCSTYDEMVKEAEQWESNHEWR